MGSSQSRPNDQLKRYSRIAGDQLKSVLRRPLGRSNTDDEKPPQDAGVAETAKTNGGHNETPIHDETEQKKGATVV